MEPLLIVVAFVLGLGARLVGLPPLVGFLAAGFALKAIGFEASDDLQRIEARADPPRPPNVLQADVVM